MDYLIRFSQSHETFRIPEIQALAKVVGADMQILHYDLEVCSSPRRICRLAFPRILPLILGLSRRTVSFSSLPKMLQEQ